MKVLLCQLVLVGLLQSCEAALTIALREPGLQSVTISVETDKTRLLHLVMGRTYHIMCRDNSPRGQFDHWDLNVWRHHGVPVTKLSSANFPGSDQAAVYSSTEVDVMVANEWTLVLQNLGVQPTEVGVYSCHDLQGRNVSFDIRETTFSVLAGVPDRVLIAQNSPTSDIVSLTSFISPPLSSPSFITWLFNGAPAPASLPKGATVVQTAVFLHSPIRKEMSGNYTCVVTAAGGSISVSAVFLVAVHAAPQIVLSPDIKFKDVISFQGSRFSVSCTDKVGFPMLDSVTWNWNGSSLLTKGDRVSVSTNRSNAWFTSDLVIFPLLPIDVGDYLCMAHNTVGVSKQHFSLTHVMAVSALDQRTMWLEGETITLQISLFSSSSSSFSSTLLQSQWLKDGLPLSEHTLLRHTSQSSVLSNGSILITMEITNAVHTDSGLYSCDLRSAVGMYMMTFDPVTVLGLDVTSLIYPTNEVLVLGSETRIVCQAVLTHLPTMITHVSTEVVWGREGGGPLGEHVQTSEMKLLDSLPSSRVYQSNLTFSPLTGGDEGGYVCSVHCKFSADGRWLVRDHTRRLVVDSSLFQLRMVGIGRDCQEWVGSEIQSKADTVVTTIVKQVNQLCPACSLTSDHVTSAVFRCFPESPQAVTFRAHLHGTTSTSSLALLEHVHTWVEKGGVIPVNLVLIPLDGLCPLLISSLGDLECEKNVSSVLSPGGAVHVVVLSASVAVGSVLVFLVIVVTSVLLVSHRCRRTLDSALTNKNSREEFSHIPVSAGNPIVLGTEPKRELYGGHTTTDPISEVLEGTEPQYEDIDKFMLEGSIINNVISAELSQTPSSFCDATNYTYDYAAV